ncbi:PAS domain-containing sensor histidine kinase [Dyadobacter arcticus]|uniref:histidine kinase n=1 Tax=Dyadobacter arcticus TaxID=1078754 RepID=A0ABX0UHM9_9BACT|nr:PAS domain-containing sensor histidine kinase [Dyadobacter arcticus]NIJ52523.1 signal transduction histidine kinase [Dyadobacter arcticus]
MNTTSSPFSHSNFDENVRLTTALELAVIGSWQLSLSDKQVWMCDQFKVQFDYQGGNVIGCEDLFELVHLDDKIRARQAFNDALVPGTAGSFNVDIRSRQYSNSAEHWLNWKGKVFFQINGEPYQFSGILQDISPAYTSKNTLVEDRSKNRVVELEDINQQLATVNEEYWAANEELSVANNRLIRSNENLEQFAYIASHDLQEPLRKIQSFGNLLKARFSEQLGEGIIYLDKMQAAARRMSVLIEDILAFSHATLQDSGISRVALNEVVNDVMVDLEAAIHQAGAAIAVPVLPQVRGDAAQLSQLFQNILSNAIKFKRKGTQPVIEIRWNIVSSLDLPDHVHPRTVTAAYDRIDISDNGIGFDQQHKDRIFKLFQRLHSKSEFEGTGIGLAICEKVIGNHGGAIGVESQIGTGSTFSIHFPIS